MISDWFLDQSKTSTKTIKGFGEQWLHIYVYMPESLCCPPETIAALLIGYTSIQNNKKFNNKNRPFHSTLGKMKEIDKLKTH